VRFIFNYLTPIIEHALYQIVHYKVILQHLFRPIADTIVIVNLDENQNIQHQITMPFLDARSPGRSD